MSEQEWEPLAIDDDTILRPDQDEARFRRGSEGHWSAWRPLTGLPVSAMFFIAQRPSYFEYEFRRRKEQQVTTITDRGSKYHRTIRQTIAGETHGCSIVVDVYDVLRAFGVTCPAAQHAVKKLLCPGLRGAKSAEQDIEEAASSCRRAIELLEADL